MLRLLNKKKTLLNCKMYIIAHIYIATMYFFLVLNLIANKLASGYTEEKEMFIEKGLCKTYVTLIGRGGCHFKCYDVTKWF